MSTIQFWQGFCVGAIVNAVLVMVFEWWQARKAR